MRSIPSVVEQRTERFDGAATAAAVPGRSASSGGCESRASDTPYLRAGKRAVVARRWWVFRRSLARRRGLTNFLALLFQSRRAIFAKRSATLGAPQDDVLQEEN